MNNSTLTTESKYEPTKLNHSNYFSSIVEQAVAVGDLSLEQAQKISFDLLMIIKKQGSNYNGDFSSSMPILLANRLTNSVLFSIDSLLLRCATVEDAVSLIKKNPLEKIFKKGQVLVEHRLMISDKIYKYICKNKISTENFAYNDSINDGINQFFLDYDEQYFSAEDCGLIDYPLALDVVNNKGINYVYNYLTRLKMENTFCFTFDNELIDKLLRGYSNEFEEDVINIFTLVLQNAIGLALIGEDIKKLNITQQNRRKIYDVLFHLSKEQLLSKLQETSDFILDNIEIKDEENSLSKYKKYARLVIKKNVALIYEAIQLCNLKNTFITLKEKEMVESLGFVDNEQMSDEDFRELINTLFASDNIEDKIEVIQEEVKSFEDLRDLLKSGAIFKNEFSTYFDTLDDTNLALLWKTVQEEKEFDRYKSVDEMLWQNAFDQYYHNLDVEKRRRVGEISLLIG